jgi:hypothetical protein
MTSSSILENAVAPIAVDGSPKDVIFQQADKRLLDSVRLHYHSNHQAEYLSLQAQIEMLFLQLQQSGEQF